MHPPRQVADALRDTLRRVEERFDPEDPDPDLLQLKRILQKRIAALEFLSEPAISD
jgi:hypothetical protein